MKFLVTKRVEISAGHYLRNVPTEHPCSAPHGHNYTIEITVSSPNLLPGGMVVDFTTISSVAKAFDHVFLNDIHPFDIDLNPTAENLALHIAKSLEPELGARVKVENIVVYETPSSRAEVIL